jgi:transcription initiation factor TFIID subunit 12
MNPQQPGPAGAGQQQVRIPMYRPEQMRSLEILSDSDKEKYERGLRGLWDAMENNDATSAAHLQAKAKIAEFSRMVFTKVATMRRQTMAQGNQPGQPQNPALAAQRAAVAQQRPGMPANAAKPAINGGVVAAPGQARPVAPQGAQPGISQQVLQHVNSLRIVPPASMANDPEKVQAFKTETKTRYIRALQLMEQATKKMQHMQTIVNTRNAKGNPLNPDEQQKFAQEMEGSKKSHAEAKKYVEGIRHQSAEALRQEAAGAGQATGQATGAAQAAQAARPQHTQAPGNPMQAATASVNAAMDAAKNLQSGAVNRQAGATPQAPSTSGPTATPTVQTTAPAAPLHPAPAPQPHVKVEPGSHPQPPPVKTALAAATVQHPATASTPTQNSARVQTPQTSTPTTAGPAGAARPLSHQAAMSLANRQSASGPAASQPGSAGAGATTTPGSAGANATTPQGGHSHAHPTPTAGAMHISKMPIPKVLPEKAVQIPQPVATAGGVQPGRPTLGSGVGMSGGTMNQPVIQKNPAYIYETEGDHIMNKKKLDELVRQVCGGGPAGQDGNYLTPDVEEVRSLFVCLFNL